MKGVNLTECRRKEEKLKSKKMLIASTEVNRIEQI